MRHRGRARGSPGLLPLILPASLSLLAAGRAAAQVEIPPEVDPYTRGEPRALERAGYVSLGPFAFGDGHSTAEVEEAVGGEPILWLETEHFCIGSGLEAYPLTGESDEREKIREELLLLRRKLPRVPSRPKELDPWLRLHLWAQRLELLYADFTREFGLAPGDVAPPGDEPGPYLGMQRRFRVLILQKESGLERYARTWLGRGGSSAYVSHFPKLDAFFLGTSAEILRGAYATDTGLQCVVVYWQVQAFLDALQGFTHLPPVWWSEGVARWFARQVDPTYQIFYGGDLAPPGEEDSDWEPKVRARVGHHFFPSTREMLGWRGLDELRFPDHLFPWSRVDYLLARKDGVARDLLLAFSAPISMDPATHPTDEELAEQQQQAFERVLGVTPEEFDELWTRWVESSYRTR